MGEPSGHGNHNYEPLRPVLFAIAYRMLGAFGDAEDLVQETMLRLHLASKRGVVIESPHAYATTVLTRLAIDQLKSARRTREEYPGEWLPEPFVTDHTQDPQASAEMSDSLSMAFLVLLESLSPPERAVLLLHDVFGYEFAEVADIIGKTEPNTRQIAVRARRAVEERRPRFEASAQRKRQLAERFFNAVENGNTETLLELLSTDVVMYSDGGGKARARVEPARTAPVVARFLANLSHQGRTAGMTLTPMEVNGQPGAVIQLGGAIVSVMSVDILDGAVTTVRAVLNPDKLRHLTAAESPKP